LHTNSPNTGRLAPLLIVPMIPGAGAVFEISFPILLDGCPIEYGCAIEYEQQINITTKIINIGFVCFMILFPSIVYLVMLLYIYALFRTIVISFFGLFLAK